MIRPQSTSTDEKFNDLSNKHMPWNNKMLQDPKSSKLFERRGKAAYD